MIMVRYENDGVMCALSLDGHAGYAPSGDDIVCAGVSGITYALLGYLEGHREELPFLCYSAESGNVLVACKGGKNVETAFEVAVTGLAQIAKKYPKHVTVTIAADGGDSRE